MSSPNTSAGKQHVFEDRPPRQEDRALEDDTDVASRARISCPSIVTLPSVLESNPATMRSNVLFPQPLGRPRTQSFLSR